MIDGDESTDWEYWDGIMGTGEWICEHGDESMGKGEWGREHGMGLQRWKHEDTVGQIHNYKLYNLWDKCHKVQMYNLHLSVSCAMVVLNYPEWYDYHHSWFLATVFILLSRQHCTIIILTIVC